MSFHYSPKIVTDGLVLYLDATNPKSYPGTGTSWYDLSGNNNISGLISGSSFNTSVGGCISLDGSNDYVNVAWTSNPSVNSFTINIWHNWNGATLSGYAGLFHGLTTSNYGRLLINGAGKYYIENGAATFFSNISILSNKWNYMSFVINLSNATQKIYNNGYEIGASTNITTPVVMSNSFMVGYGYSLPTYYIYSGLIANVSFYNRPLADSEILQNYITLKSRFGL